MKTRASLAAVLVVILCAAPTVAQTDLADLWPLEAGRSWEFDFRVEGPFDQLETGVLIQNVITLSEPSPGRTRACFNVSSSSSPAKVPRAVKLPELTRRVVAQPSMLLALPDCALGVGVVIEDGVAMGVWDDMSSDWAWWWLGESATPGATFSLPIATQVADDAFVNGEVRTDSGTVETPAGTFNDVLIVDYVVELGESEVTDELGGVIGTVTFEVVGWVAFAPAVGPVASEEAFAAIQIDCPTCPPAIYESITTTTELRSTSALATERVTFGSIKAKY